MKTKVNDYLVKVINFLLPVTLALILGAIAIIIAGQNPFEVYASIINSAFFNRTGFLNTLTFATPIMLTGIGVVLAFSGGVWNLGGEGQMLCGGFAAAYLGFTLTGLPAWLHIPICLIGGILGGMLFALIPAIMKAKFRINEMVTTLMLNYVAITLFLYLTNGPFAYSYQYSSTKPIEAAAILPAFIPKNNLTSGIIIALVVGIAAWVVMKKTKFGYEISALGKQQEFADAVGMRVSKKIIHLFLISGGIAGLAGAIEIMAIHHRFLPNFAEGLGWDGMLAAMLGGYTPLGTIVSSIVFGAFKFGGVSLQVKFGVPGEIIQIIQSSMILFLSVKFLKNKKLLFWKKKEEDIPEVQKVLEMEKF